MKVLQINTFPHKATGTIMLDLKTEIERTGNEAVVVWGRGRKANKKNNEYSIENKIEIIIHGLLTRMCGVVGRGSIYSTKKLLRIIDNEEPDIVHLHNIHGYYLDFEMLFSYIKKKNIQVVWTFHDCWPITGHCAYFDTVGCNKWKTGCDECPQIYSYPKTFIDRSRENWLEKKDMFTGDNIHIVTVSKWLEGIVKESFLKNQDISTIYNGIDLNRYKNVTSDFRKRNNCENKKIILGVASEWTERKGFNDFLKLSKMLDGSFVIVLVGLNEKQKKASPSNIIGMGRTSSRDELIEIYSTADVFLILVLKKRWE